MSHLRLLLIPYLDVDRNKYVELTHASEKESYSRYSDCEQSDRYENDPGPDQSYVLQGSTSQSESGENNTESDKDDNASRKPAIQGPKKAFTEVPMKRVKVSRCWLPGVWRMIDLLSAVCEF
ncbi:uncharacterized protein ATNIH1004_006496 [Aspergillus tanneri]|uniref:Uncharacterized protein n=1 Tax=Aspergillus tanneri TaxID=1220188 RepID=A0A5M9MLA9_9EURO|nr:uncharacterized protein ATNIH1004_006496 [Aspergillus tanneri]KAA8647795.1 hypothetical protein ATNIH1004_006496 [Aspergillus tanneri]